MPMVGVFLKRWLFLEVCVPFTRRECPIKIVDFVSVHPNSPLTAAQAWFGLRRFRSVQCPA
jgi:hypothetical protein